MRTAREEDLGALRRVAKNDHASAPSVTQLASAVAGNLGYGIVLAEDAEGVLAYLLHSQILDELTVINILVMPSQRRRGIAKGLMAAMLENAAELGIARCLLEVRASNHAAQRLYESLGFVCDGRRKNYYPKGSDREDALLMSLTVAGYQEQVE
ncbi:MAG: ribosomal protein S18-alanine N-acetyltransferase [Halioglobus sp.]